MQNTYLILDVETGGLDPNKHSLLEVGLLARFPGGETKEFSCRIAEPEIVIDPYLLHRVTDGSNKLALEANSDKWEGLHPLTACNLIACWLSSALAGVEPRTVFMSAHNTPFDTGFIRRLWRLAGDEAPHCPSILTGYHSLDTYSLATLAHRRNDIPKSGRLNDIVEALGLEQVPEADRHTALGDCRLQLQVLLALLNKGADAVSALRP